MAWYYLYCLALSDKNGKLSSEKVELQNKLINQKDYMEVKKELDILKGSLGQE